MATKEDAINFALARVLVGTRHVWREHECLHCQRPQMPEDRRRQPDILLVEPGVCPVAVETERPPAAEVETAALAFLGETVRGAGAPVLSAVAVRLPSDLATKQGEALRAELRSTADLAFALFTGRTPATAVRWPHTGWLVGGVQDLSLLVQAAAIPPVVIEEAADHLAEGVAAGAALLSGLGRDHPGTIEQISKELCQEPGRQTFSMAATILVNALVFQQTLAGGRGDLADVKSLGELRGANTCIGKLAVLTEWRKILRITHWPLFDLARRILEPVPADEAGELLAALAATAELLVGQRLVSSPELTGTVLQKVIADRKFLAAFYTTPPAAALLVGLAITPEATPAGGSWRNPDDVRALRIADFACGTGTLLSTAYHRVGQLHELAGGNAAALHADLMADGITGCDILPAATHLTAAMLAGAHPTIKYERSSIFTLAYGQQQEGHVALGALDLLDPRGKLTMHPIMAKAPQNTNAAERETWQTLPHASFDVVLMNPPFTNAGIHTSKMVGAPNPVFAAFGSTPEEQQAMGRAAKRLTAGSGGCGNAGEAAVFLVLADRKLKPGGLLALVMPLSLISGEAWEESRVLLGTKYRDLVLVSIAGAGDADLSFSADTGMGECLVVARKLGAENGAPWARAGRATFVILRQRPELTLLGASVAGQIRQLTASGGTRRLEDGPQGGTPLCFGDEEIGQALDAPLPQSGGWNLARIADLSLAQVAFQLATEGRLWLPTMERSDAIGLPMTKISAIGAVGPHHRDINGKTPTGGIRGPFDILPAKTGTVPSYPVLWAHAANRERTMAFAADCEGRPRRAPTPDEQPAVERKVAAVWATASHCHFNLDFRFNSQSTAMQFTPRKAIGGRAWISISLASAEQEKALVLWANTSLGLLLYWWHANKQQSGRGSIQKLALRSLPTLDVKALNPTQLAAAVSLFDALSNQPLLPLHELSTDANRRTLDQRFAREVLGLPEGVLAPGGPFDVLRDKLSKEPSIRGSK